MTTEPTQARTPQCAWLFSDLHQEWPENRFDPLAHAPDRFDLILIAGDIATPLTASLRWIHERFAGMPTFFTPGNHEFYWDGGETRYTIWDQIDQGRELAETLGIHRYPRREPQPSGWGGMRANRDARLTRRTERVRQAR